MQWLAPGGIRVSAKDAPRRAERRENPEARRVFPNCRLGHSTKSGSSCREEPSGAAVAHLPPSPAALSTRAVSSNEASSPLGIGSVYMD